MSGTGVELRMDILRRAAEQQMLKPLRTHGWTAGITAEMENGEYLIILASKQGIDHKVALMYTSATDNKHYRDLEREVSHIFTNGALYRLASFAYGISTPVAPIDDFFPLVIDWNKQLAPAVPTRSTVPPPGAIRNITAEHPADGVWSHLSLLASVKLAEKLVRRRALRASIELTEAQVETKAMGVAFNVRSATDYFRGVPHESMNKRILSLYYGSLALAFAEMLASPTGPMDLDEVEGMTKQGHGLFTVPSTTDDFGGLTIGVLATGFFPRWTSFLGYDTSSYPRTKPKTPSDLHKLKAGTATTLADLLSTLPELGDMFLEVYEREPSWVMSTPDMDSNFTLGQHGVGSSYVLFIDRSGRLSGNRLHTNRWPIAELTEIQTEGVEGNCFRARVDHPYARHWHEVLPLHRSPFLEGNALILPVLAGVSEHRAISVSILYALSILVRYMPSAWRRVEGGDWDQHLVLIRTALNVAERLLPQQFLESITGDKVYSRQAGSFI